VAGVRVVALGGRAMARVRSAAVRVLDAVMRVLVQEGPSPLVRIHAGHDRGAAQGAPPK
jgi:hypothetical protein